MNTTVTADESGGGGAAADEPPLAAAAPSSLPSSLPRQPSPFAGLAVSAAAAPAPQQQQLQQQQQQQFQQQQQPAPLRSPRATPPPPPPQQPPPPSFQQPPPPSSSNRPSATDDIDEDDDVVVETDPTGRYVRYDRLVGSGRFKRVYRGFDERAGIDVAWSKVSAETGATALYFNHLYDPISLVRDNDAKAALSARGVAVRSFCGDCLFEPWHVLSKG